MISSVNAASSAVDAQTDGPPSSNVAPARSEDPRTRLTGERAPRPAPANWRGCGFRRSWLRPAGGRAA